jgi:hypothetical protein
VAIAKAVPVVHNRAPASNMRETAGRCVTLVFVEVSLLAFRILVAFRVFTVPFPLPSVCINYCRSYDYCDISVIFIVATKTVFLIAVA